MGENAVRLAKSKDRCSTKCVHILKIMDMCPGKVKNAAPSGCALSTTKILYNKNDPPPALSLAEARIHQYFLQRGRDNLSFWKC